VNQILLRYLNAPLLLLLTLLGLGIQTSLFSFWPLQYVQPDLVLFIAVWMALRRSFLEGGILTLLTADFAELHSAVPQGVFLMTYLTVFLSVRALSKLIVIPNLSSLIVITVFVSVFWKLETLLILHLLGGGAHQWKQTLLYLFPGAVSEGVLGFWVYRALDRYDTLTFKRRRADRHAPAGESSAYGEPELLLAENEGI
jgi:hypothetical protein